MENCYYRQIVFLSADFQRVWLSSVRRGEIVYPDRIEIDEMIRRLIVKAINAFFPCNVEGLEQFKLQVFLIYHYISHARFVHNNIDDDIEFEDEKSEYACSNDDDDDDDDTDEYS